MTRIPSSFFALILLLAVSLAPALPGHAMEPGAFFGDGVDSDTSFAPTIPDDRLAFGKVVAVDETRGRITLEFRPIPQQFLEGGTRIFDVADATALKGLSKGDKVRFDVERDGRRYVVTRLENTN